MLVSIPIFFAVTFIAWGLYAISRGNPEVNIVGYEAGMATILMAIQATALGLMFHQMAGYSRKTLRELFEIPDEYVIFTAIAVGYPGTIGQTPEKDRAGETAPRERVPQEQFSHWNGW